jgi:hypothetical protein
MSRYLRPERRCAYEGCETLTRARLGYCTTHYYVAHACVFDVACPYRCAAHNRARLCQEHAWFAGKMRRAKITEVP